MRAFRLPLAALRLRGARGDALAFDLCEGGLPARGVRHVGVASPRSATHGAFAHEPRRIRPDESPRRLQERLTGAAFLGTVGLDWQFAGIAPISGAGRSDLVLRNVLEAHDGHSQTAQSRSGRSPAARCGSSAGPTELVMPGLVPALRSRLPAPRILGALLVRRTLPPRRRRERAAAVDPGTVQRISRPRPFAEGAASVVV
jgi:hypothetical protein